MAVSGVSAQMLRMPWIAIGLATAAIAMNYIYRSTLAIGNLTIRHEFGLNATAIGTLQSVGSINLTPAFRSASASCWTDAVR